MQGGCLAECLLGGTLLLPSCVRSSKRETEPDVGLLPVLILQSIQLAELNIHEWNLPYCSDCRQVPSGHPRVVAVYRLWLHFSFDRKEPIPISLGSLAPLLNGADCHRITMVLSFAEHSHSVAQ